MTVREALEKLKGQRVYFGTKNNFITIGLCDDQFIKKVDQESDQYFVTLQRALKNARAKQKVYKDQIEQLEKIINEKGVKPKLNYYKKMYKRTFKTIDNSMAKLEAWKDILDRDVKAMYWRDVYGPGWVVLADGSELGRIWNEGDKPAISYAFNSDTGGLL